MFAHECGIHADGVIKNPKTYEVFTPDEVGLERQIVIGKHSGSQAIELQVPRVRHRACPTSRRPSCSPLVRQMSIELKRSLFDKELLYIYKDFMTKQVAEAVGE